MDCYAWWYELAGIAISDIAASEVSRVTCIVRYDPVGRSSPDNAHRDPQQHLPSTKTALTPPWSTPRSHRIT
jgi:hypothetical protein